MGEVAARMIPIKARPAGPHRDDALYRRTTLRMPRNIRDSSVCMCGRPKSIGSRSCRECWSAGRGAQRGKKAGQLSVRSVLDAANAANLKPGQSITINGLTLTKIKK
jgi:hypothetical protein